MFSKQISKTYESISFLSYGLCVFNEISKKEVYISFQRLLKSFSDHEPKPSVMVECYHNFCSLAIRNNWPEILFDTLFEEENQFTREINLYGYENIAPNVRLAVARDFRILQELSGITAKKIKAAAKRIFNNYFTDNLSDSNFESNGLFDQKTDELINPENWPEWNSMDGNYQIRFKEHNEVRGAQSWLQSKRNSIINVLNKSVDWSKDINLIVDYYLKVGTGIYGKYVAFRWQYGNLTGIPEPDPFCLEELIGINRELEVILENTEHFLKGYHANNILLYGDRGTGKSSIIKALLNKYVSRGLRLIELSKSDIGDIPQIMPLLRYSLQKFIIFIDDLSFEENEVEYKYLKTFLEGTLEVRPQNVVVYATSNRRHIIRETVSERDGNEIHMRDGIEEKLSLADRFGITVTFTSPNQKKYLDIVDGLVFHRELTFNKEKVHELALRWQMWHNGLSGRTARQFVDYLTAGILSGTIEDEVK
jgi:predicted AAA+ superfamily ATPase